MKHSENLSATSKNEAIQLPLKGFRVKAANGKPSWTMWIEGMGDGRFRTHMVKNKK